MHIDDYQFGRITIGGRVYTSDVIIYPDRVEPNWRRRRGHRLEIEDLRRALEEKPDLIVVGTGMSGVMKVPDSAIEELRRRGVEVIALPTAEAVEIFNRSARRRKALGALHLTC